MPRSLPRVKLDRSPLVLVLVQARFSHRPELESRLPVFRKACESLGYPVFRPGRIRTVNFGALGPTDTVDAPRWDFLDKSQRWNIILAPEFLMLQTTEYPVFEEFLERWRLVLEAAKCLEIPVIERLGLRYVDLIQPEPDERVSKYLDPALAGYEPQAGSGMARSIHSASTVLKTALGTMLVRVSPATSPFPPDLDQLHLKGLSQPRAGAVFLDFDHASGEILDFDPGAIATATDGLHGAHESLFREVVTPHAMRVWGRKEIQ